MTSRPTEAGRAVPIVSSADDGGTVRRDVLVSTLPLWGGGVMVMTTALVSLLRRRGLSAVLAYHKPYSLAPDLSVPSFRLLTRRVGAKRTTVLDGCEAHEIGAWLPELEFTHYFPSRVWKGLMESSRWQVAVSGSPLAALPFVLTGRDFLLWTATPWMDDRLARVQALPFYRRWLDALVVRPVCQALERRVLRSGGTILALSEHTRRRLNELAGAEVVADVLRIPIDSRRFRPRPEAVVTGRVGFVGRFNDPRKNIGLLLEAVRRLRDGGISATAVLVGNQVNDRVTALIQKSGLGDALEVVPFVKNDELPGVLQGVDVFVVPSQQEGLCIAALEAMACGCPVVSTRCGGPEEFVVDGRTGYLVAPQAEELASRLASIIQDRQLRARLALGAREMVAQRFAPEAAEDVLDRAWRRAFGG